MAQRATELTSRRMPQISEGCRRISEPRRVEKYMKKKLNQLKKKKPQGKITEPRRVEEMQRKN